MNNTHPPHRRTARLPLGYKATFSFSAETGLVVAWHPGRPQIESPRAWRKFHSAYVAARDAFLAEAATLTGAAVLVANADGGVSVVRPEGRTR